MQGKPGFECGQLLAVGRAAKRWGNALLTPTTLCYMCFPAKSQTCISHCGLGSSLPQEGRGDHVGKVSWTAHTAAKSPQNILCSLGQAAAWLSHAHIALHIPIATLVAGVPGCIFLPGVWFTRGAALYNAPLGLLLLIQIGWGQLLRQVKPQPGCHHQPWITRCRQLHVKHSLSLFLSSKPCSRWKPTPKGLILKYRRDALQFPVQPSPSSWRTAGQK